VGKVKSNKLDSEGRIEITLEGVSGNAKTYPARVATFMAGDQRGFQFLPEEQDQVLVAFEQGRIELPVVIGTLWSADKKPPDMNVNGANNVKLIKTLGGNEIRIIDERNKESIEILSPHGKISITADTITLDGKVHITGTLDVGPDAGPKTHIDKNEITGG